MTSLSVEHLSKCYRIGRKQPREIWALRDVSFAVEPGTILGIIGPNGAGKTTLLKIIARVTPPTEGRVVGRGRVVSLLEMGAGFHPDLSGRDNVFLNAALYGIPRTEVQRRLEDIIGFAELGESIDNPLRSYSTGMYLRLAFSIAVHMEPDILLADEILAVGDIAFQERCLQRVQEAGQEGLTVLFVSHDMAAITRLCQRVAWLNAGAIVACGDPEDVVTQYQAAAWSLSGSASKRRKELGRANDYGEILSVRLVSAEGQEIGAARVSDEVSVKLAFAVREAGLRVRCQFDVYTRGIHAFRSVQPWERSLPEPGVYSAAARIPGHLLAETMYSVDVAIGVFRDEACYPLTAYNALTFQVYDTDAAQSARGTFKGRLAGAVTPRLEWTLVREPDVPA